MTLVADASVVVSALTEPGREGDWARAQLSNDRLASPHMMLFEAANTFKKQALRGLISWATAEGSHRRLLEMQVSLSAYEVTAHRAWELRDNFSIYDASYIALAELLDAPLVTLDKRLARGPGFRCEVLVFDG